MQNNEAKAGFNLCPTWGGSCEGCHVKFGGNFADFGEISILHGAAVVISTLGKLRLNLMHGVMK